MKTAAEYRAEAKECFDREQRSFERCDTDGFLSQWSANISGHLAEARADIAENGGNACLPVLVDAEGELVPAKMIPTQYGSAWLLSPEAASRYGRKFVPVGEGSRVQKQLKLREEHRDVPAFARIHGSGRGLSGAASCYVVTQVDYAKLGWNF